MDKLVAILQRCLMPVAKKLNTNRYIKAMRDGFVLSLPYTMAGSLLTAFLGIPAFASLLGEETMQTVKAFMNPANLFSNSIIAVFVVIGIAYSLAKSYDLDPLHGAMVSFVSFMILCPSVVTADGGVNLNNVIDMGYLGSRAIFTAIVMAILSVEVYRWSLNHKMGIKLPASVPQSIQNSFTAFIPAAITMIVAMSLRQLLTFTTQGNLTDFIFYWVQRPLTGLALNLPCMVLQGVLVNLFWFFGLHGQTMVSSVFRPFLSQAGVENLEALLAGNALPNIFCATFQHVWTTFGFWISVPLLIALWMYRKKRKDWAGVMKIALIPGLFNIYEPLMFGLPLVLNPFMLIPMLITPIVTTLLGYIVTVTGICGIPTGVMIPIVTPVFLSGVLGTNTLTAGIIQLLMMVPLSAMWYLFLSIQDKSERENGTYDEEAEENAES
ncbi:MAG: PTS transporter subunit EIIC [Lachnospiraceae bacterium]|nr:PTS transporter subunit EIIC [Lachnospiraceae bacterium]